MLPGRLGTPRLDTRQSHFMPHFKVVFIESNRSRPWTLGDCSAPMERMCFFRACKFVFFHKLHRIQHLVIYLPYYIRIQPPKYLSSPLCFSSEFPLDLLAPYCDAVNLLMPCCTVQSKSAFHPKSQSPWKTNKTRRCSIKFGHAKSENRHSELLLHISKLRFMQTCWPPLKPP